MKICLTCNRTYDDETLNFCLVDGTVLSDSNDPYETQRIPASRSTSTAPTEVLHMGPSSDSPPPTLYPTIPAPQPPRHSAKQQYQSQEKRSGRTGLIIGIAVVLGIILGVGITLSLLKTSGGNATGDHPDSKMPGGNSNTPVATPTSRLTELSGDRWKECETNVVEYCGVWTRIAGEQWRGQWAGVESKLTISVNGKNVTVIRRDVTQSTEATYRGTLNEDNTEITGTVDWCCDTWGNRSGKWNAHATGAQK